MAGLLVQNASAGDGLDRVDQAPIGEILARMGLIEIDDLDHALSLQPLTGRRLGEVLLAQSAVSPRDLTAAVARQWDLGTVDLRADPPDPELIVDGDLDAYVEHKILPWKQLGGIRTYAITEPEQARKALAALSDSSPFAFFALTTAEDMQDAMSRMMGPQMAARAASRTPARFSVRSLGGIRPIAAMAFGVLALALYFATSATVAVALLALFALNASTTALRLAAVIASRKEAHAPAPMEGTIDFMGKRRPPKISLLVPVYREARVIPGLIAALQAIDYPRELTEVLILCEEDDADTRAALATQDLPGWFRTITVPQGAPRTKPRALNHALDFADGEIIGILDAEDHPDPGQLTQIAGILRGAPREVACVQCQLSYYNSTENWVTRCFQIEYSIWFEVLLRGFQRLGLPIPLGGTSVYFRRSALQELGAWDAHNVTEDADLGMRLARAGMRCAVAPSITLEEANCRMLPWIRQRSRWLKGYMLTWMTHMRAPARLWSDLGPKGFLTLNVLFLGAAVTYLAVPLFWIALFGWILHGETVWSSAIPGWAIWPAATSLAIGQVVMLGCASLALKRRGAFGLLIWVPTLPVYWTLGAIAAWKAIAELLIAPFYWDKTQHGITKVTIEIPTEK